MFLIYSQILSTSNIIYYSIDKLIFIFICIILKHDKFGSCQLLPLVVIVGSHIAGDIFLF